MFMAIIICILSEAEDKNIIGRGMSIDIVEASVMAYLDGINKLIRIINNSNGNQMGNIAKAGS